MRTSETVHGSISVQSSLFLRLRAYSGRTYEAAPMLWLNMYGDVLPGIRVKPTISIDCGC